MYRMICYMLSISCDSVMRLSSKARAGQFRMKDTAYLYILRMLCTSYAVHFDMQYATQSRSRQCGEVVDVIAPKK